MLCRPGPECPDRTDRVIPDPSAPAGCADLRMAFLRPDPWTFFLPAAGIPFAEFFFRRCVFLYIAYTGPKKQYAIVAVTKRNGTSTTRETVHYLGRVLDREAGIYRNKERGIFTYDLATGEFGPPPEGYVPPLEDRRSSKEHINVDFGDAFFLDSFLYGSGLMDMLGTLGFENPDTLRAMIQFYLLSNLTLENAPVWFQGSIAQLLFPQADLTPSGLRGCLASIGKPENLNRFWSAWLRFVRERFGPDRTLLIDLPCLSEWLIFQFPWLTHDDDFICGLRLVLVLQKSTGLPLYFRVVPGTSLDSESLGSILQETRSLGIDVPECIPDAEYGTGADLDIFYDNSRRCTADFIIKADFADPLFRSMLRSDLRDLDQKEQRVLYDGIPCYIRKKQIRAGSRGDCPAWMYLGVPGNYTPAIPPGLIDQAESAGPEDTEVFEALKAAGVFGFLSGRDLSCEEILPAYDLRQDAEPPFSFIENFRRLLSVGVGSEEVLNGHLLLSVLSICILRLMQSCMNFSEPTAYRGLYSLRNQKCSIYTFHAVPDDAMDTAEKMYKAFQIRYPDEFKILDGRIQYEPPAAGTISLGNQGGTQRSAAADRKDSGQEVSGSIPAESGSTPAGAADVSEPQPPKRGRGRPKGSKNRTKHGSTSADTADAPEPQPPKRGRGRPKGSKNRTKSGSSPSGTGDSQHEADVP